MLKIVLTLEQPILFFAAAIYLVIVLKGTSMNVMFLDVL